MKQGYRGVLLSPGVTLGLSRDPSILNLHIKPHSCDPEGMELVTRKESEQMMGPGGQRKAVGPQGIIQHRGLGLWEAPRPVPAPRATAAW